MVLKTGEPRTQHAILERGELTFQASLDSYLREGWVIVPGTFSVYIAPNDAPHFRERYFCVVEK